MRESGEERGEDCGGGSYLSQLSGGNSMVEPFV